MERGRTLIVIFGAKVRPDGRPSQALARRIGYAARAALAEPEADVMCSGAAGPQGPSEAVVMARALVERGVAPARLILDEKSRDTLQSAAAAARLISAGGYGRCLACSDRYHLPRIRLLLRALGVKAQAVPTAPGHGGAGHAHWNYMRLRELAATPYDVALALANRRRLLTGPG